MTRSKHFVQNLRVDGDVDAGVALGVDLGNGAAQLVVDGRGDVALGIDAILLSCLSG